MTAQDLLQKQIMRAYDARVLELVSQGVDIGEAADQADRELLVALDRPITNQF